MMKEPTKSVKCLHPVKLMSRLYGTSQYELMCKDCKECLPLTIGDYDDHPTSSTR